MIVINYVTYLIYNMNTTTVLSHEIIQSVMRRTHVCTSMHGAFKSANPLRPSVSVCTSQQGNLWLAYTDRVELLVGN